MSPFFNKEESRRLQKYISWSKNQDDPVVKELVGYINFLHHKALHYKIRSEKLEQSFTDSRKRLDRKAVINDPENTL